MVLIQVHEGSFKHSKIQNGEPGRAKDKVLCDFIDFGWLNWSEMTNYCGSCRNSRNGGTSRNCRNGRNWLFKGQSYKLTFIQTIILKTVIPSLGVFWLK